jgi:uncharacterized protein (TIGR04222 family)
MHPWGLSGPVFLWLYVIGLVAGLGVIIGVRRAVRRPPQPEPPAVTDDVELGFLAGGPVNAVQVAVARLVQAGLVRVNRSGTLTATSPGGTSGAPLDDALLAELTGSRTVTHLMRRPAVERVVDGLGEALVRRGLLVAPGRAVRARRLAPILLYVVFGVGVVRWINGVGNDLPVGYLTFLLAVTLSVIVFLNVRAFAGVDARTVHGDRVVAAVRAQGDEAEPLARAAVSGPRVHPDTDLAHALSFAAPVGFLAAGWTYASAGSFATYTAAGGSSSGGGGGYSCGSSSSSSCGGSSCGGGGCGGGSS